ncbi:hypothetical protein LPICM17_350032 [Lactococcus piscium]|nr:hypothetical protein LPICM17_350032 [Lactococcus piscium]
MKKIIVIVTILIGIIIGALGGYFYKNSKNIVPVLPDGKYTVVATWDWKSLSVDGNKYILDDSRKYEVIGQDSNTGIIVINTVSDAKKKSTQVYKIIKSGNSYKWHIVANGNTSDKVAATVTKK